MMKLFAGMAMAAGLLGAPPGGQPSGDELHLAAAAGDLDQVEALLAAGVSVDAPNRYGATALFFAADRGRLAVVRRLVEAGAELGIEDRFYQMTALSRAAGSGHREVVLFLLGQGSPGAGGVLIRAARDSDRELLEAVLENGRFDGESLAAAREAAAGEPALAGLLAAATPEASAVSELAAAELELFAGRYWNETLEQGVVVTVRADGLEAREFAGAGGSLADAPPIRLASTARERSFATEDGADRFDFPGRGGMVERLVVARGDEWVVYQPEDETESRAAAAEAPDPVRPSAVRRSADLSAPLRPRPWPQFRGPGGSGIADAQDVPLTWDAPAGEGIRWEAAVPGLGVSSPVVWEDRVFVVSAASVTGDTEFRIGLYGDVAPVENESEHRFALHGFDLLTGAPVFETTLREGAPKTRRHTKSSQANATPVTDGRRIVTLLGSMGALLCHDLDGNLLWERDVGVLNSGWFYDPDYQWGHASSPVIHDDAVIVLADVHGDAFVGAFRLEDGEPIWRSPRDEVSTFSTPLVHEAGGVAEVVVNGTTIRGYDAGTGEERWRLGPNSEIPIGVPLLGDGLLFVQAGYPPIRPIYAIRPGATGDISLARGEDTNEAIAWSRNRGGVYIPSPLFYRGVLYLNANNGRLAAYDGETGERLYRARIGGVGGSYAASPFAADGRLYFTSEEGDTYVVRAGREYELLAKNTVDRIVMASPAASNGVLLIRALDRLYAISNPAP